MSDFTKVTASEMSAGIDALKRAYTDFDGHLDELKGQLQGSLAQWDGAAREAYQQEQQVWDQSAAKIVEIINKMTTVLNSITSGYAENERAIQGNWGA